MITGAYLSTSVDAALVSATARERASFTYSPGRRRGGYRVVKGRD